ncbi:pollen-specific leucine-rich repeat extensin-like protein 4 [Hevea brasiliensis]|nr:pollen-specific leucine-rich repeat extensin-like protein 4 [Hevea brasiliensis]
MESNIRFYCNRVCLAIFLLHLSLAANNCEARKSMHLLRGPMHPTSSIIQHLKNFKVTKHFDLASLLVQKETMNPSNTDPYVSSPFSLPPYDSLSPNPLPENAPPFCIYPPNTPLPPSTTIPTPSGSTPNLPPPSPFSYIPPTLPIPSPPPGPIGVVPSPPETTPIPNPPEIVPSPPTLIPGPPETVPSPITYMPSPPGSVLSPPYPEFSPPTFVPSPTGYVPSPTIFLPPVVYPPPIGPPPPRTGPPQALWCVAKPSVPDPIIQEAMNYACASGADCDSIQPNGSCFEPNTLFAHASYAFNSYWQRTKVAGGTCSFGGTAMLVTVDPSYDGCHFVYS